MNGNNYLDGWEKQLEEADRQSLAGQWGEFADEFTEFWAMLSEPILDMVSGWLVRLRGWWQG